MARPSLMFQLGRFVGGIVRAVGAPLDKSGSRRVVRHEVNERTTREGDATVTLRRTIIEEVEVRPTPHGEAP